MRSFDELLKESAESHGHLCPGQLLGVRMATLGCQMVGVDEPRASKRLIVYVEIDRCATDAIQAVTGCKLGKRTLKHMDYGKMAATFVNTATGEAVRILARDDARERVWRYADAGVGKQQAQLRAYRLMPDEDLFVVAPVRLVVPEEDLPGHPVSRVACQQCGEGVNDRRETVRDGRVLCRRCADGGYYTVLDDSAAAAEAAARR